MHSAIPDFHPWRWSIRLGLGCVLSALLMGCLFVLGFAMREKLAFEVLRAIFFGAGFAFLLTGCLGFAAVLAVWYGSCHTCPVCRQPFSRTGMLSIPLLSRCLNCGYKIGTPIPTTADSATNSIR